VLTVDLHSPPDPGVLSMPADQLTAVPVLCERLRAEGFEDAIVVAADVGEAKDAAVFAKHLGCPSPSSTSGGPAPRSGRRRWR